MGLDHEQYTQQSHVQPFVLPPVVRWIDRDPGDETEAPEPPIHVHCRGFVLGHPCCGCGAFPELDD